MKKLKLMTVIGTRPEIIRLSAVIKLADQCFNHILVHTGQNYDYELNKVFFDNLQLREPDYYLDAAKDHSSLGETIGNIIAESFVVIEKEKPDALLILGDTNSSLVAYAAKRMKVPIFHMEAGNRCFDQNVPEEINRRIVDHISDVNLPYTENSRKYLLSEGIKKEYIFVTGSPMLEVLNLYRKEIEASKILERLALQKSKYIVVSAHREENIDNKDRFFRLMNAMNKVAEYYKMPIIYSAHPRSSKFIQQHGFKFDARLKEMKPFGFFDYNALQMNSFVVLSDSGTLSEESAILNFPAVLIRNSTERPEAIDKGSIVMGGIDAVSILNAVEVVRQTFSTTTPYALPEDYQDNNVSIKIIRIIQSYTPIINEFTWRKD